jgi:tetratricopeptide (TPR) repeat protein
MRRIASISSVLTRHTRANIYPRGILLNFSVSAQRRILMNNSLEQVSAAARRAIQQQDWATVSACSNEILRNDGDSAEGYFLAGVVERAARHPAMAAQAFERSLQLDAARYDAAIELANQYSVARRNGDAAALLERYQEKLGNSPIYLDMAGTVYNDIGLPEKAWPLYQKANELQPGIDLFQGNLAACGVYLGKIDEAKTIYRGLLNKHPKHRRNHYRLSRLEKARDDSHVNEMQAILDESTDTPDQNIFMYFAIAKELEDLERWDESFEFYQKAGDAVTSVADYDVATDIQLIDEIIEVCDENWIGSSEPVVVAEESGQAPLFIVGLPRTGTTLTERILASHSNVQSLGETRFLQMVLRDESGVHSVEQMNPEMIRALSGKDMQQVADRYEEALNYRTGEEPLFIDKLPFNFLYLGFIAKAWPNARIVCQLRNPLDACFSMYKQLFTWAYKYSYSLDNLGRYYIAHHRLLEHWRKVLGPRMIEVSYEAMVADQEGETRSLLGRIGLEFEPACLEFERNRAPTTTASSVQVRAKVYDESVAKWTRFASQLQPLREQLESAGIAVD